MKHKMGEKFIVKVQTPLFGLKKNSYVLVYDESQTILEELPAPKGLKVKMLGEPKQFLWAWLEKRGKLIDLHLGDVAPWQDW